MRALIRSLYLQLRAGFHQYARDEADGSGDGECFLSTYYVTSILLGRHTL